jgi:hypothetical protein
MLEFIIQKEVEDQRLKMLGVEPGDIKKINFEPEDDDLLTLLGVTPDSVSGFRPPSPKKTPIQKVPKSLPAVPGSAGNSGNSSLPPPESLFLRLSSPRKPVLNFGAPERPNSVPRSQSALGVSGKVVSISPRSQELTKSGGKAKEEGGQAAVQGGQGGGPVVKPRSRGSSSGGGGGMPSEASAGQLRKSMHLLISQILDNERSRDEEFSQLLERERERERELQQSLDNQKRHEEELRVLLDREREREAERERMRVEWEEARRRREEEAERERREMQARIGEGGNMSKDMRIKELEGMLEKERARKDSLERDVKELREKETEYVKEIRGLREEVRAIAIDRLEKREREGEEEQQDRQRRREVEEQRKEAWNRMRMEVQESEKLKNSLRAEMREDEERMRKEKEEIRGAVEEHKRKMEEEKEKLRRIWKQLEERERALGVSGQGGGEGGEGVQGGKEPTKIQIQIPSVAQASTIPAKYRNYSSSSPILSHSSPRLSPSHSPRTSTSDPPSDPPSPSSPLEGSTDAKKRARPRPGFDPARLSMSLSLVKDRYNSFMSYLRTSLHLLQQLDPDSKNLPTLGDFIPTIVSEVRRVGTNIRKIEWDDVIRVAERNPLKILEIMEFITKGMEGGGKTGETNLFLGIAEISLTCSENLGHILDTLEKQNITQIINKFIFCITCM